jgi:hypothetical protein
MFIGVLRLTGQRMTTGLEAEARVCLETAGILFTIQIGIYKSFLTLRMAVIKIIYA